MEHLEHLLALWSSAHARAELTPDLGNTASRQWAAARSLPIAAPALLLLLLGSALLAEALPLSPPLQLFLVLLVASNAGFACECLSCSAESRRLCHATSPRTSGDAPPLTSPLMVGWVMRPYMMVSLIEM